MNAERLLRKFTAKQKKRLRIAGLYLEDKMHEIVAIDTGNLDTSIRTDAVKDTPAGLSVEVGSFGVPYAIYVDQPTSRGEKNFHRFGRVVYSGNGQQFRRRALNQARAGIIQILSGFF